MEKKTKNRKRQHLIQLAGVLLVLLLINLISSMLFTRFDLTSEKRYTLSPSTKKILKNLDDIVFFRVYLEGDFPAGFKRLQSETKELLDEFRAYNKNIQYEFINPSANENVQERNDTYQLLMEQGLQPTNLQVKTKSGLDQQVIFPGALVTYKNNEAPIELLDAQINVPPEAVLNNSIQNLEYKFTNAIRKISRKKKPVIAFVRGHGELDDDETFDIAATLAEDYIVDRLVLNGQVNALVNRSLIDSVNNEYKVLPKYAAIIIAKPGSVFPPKDKFIIDQYIMYGGKVLWLIDPVFASMDSIQRQESTVAVQNDIGLRDQLFTYGARLNENLVMDLVALSIPLRTGQIGNQPQISFFPWYYFPLLTPFSKHPIVKNLNTIKTQFVSSIDTIKSVKVKKTILLQTSPYSRLVPVPAMISLAITREQPDERFYSGPPQTVAVLLEGVFPSDFRNRIPPSIAEAKEIGFKAYSNSTAMIVVSDGDIIRNQFYKGKPLPLGYDQFTRETFGNKDFILNALNYLTDGADLISLRSRELKLSLLDKTKVNKNRLLWQMFNLLAPVFLVVLVGLVLVWLRKRKYAA
ncbi:MAG: gliding motility-associated ABC transporter substrate-binding protein GldG [Bacteroidales bacterium]|nr:gliding motility-associated ABC transporter substrate-binding protein GldG [Bacteroidales bacterium]MCF6341586.1 gliding motility-associated ABC transporter substrate-binding protein GldG [Bacteroidales bacterium]